MQCSISDLRHYIWLEHNAEKRKNTYLSWIMLVCISDRLLGQHCSITVLNFNRREEADQAHHQKPSSSRAASTLITGPPTEMPYEDCASCSKPYLAVRAKEGEFHCSPCVSKVGRDQLPKTARTSCVHNDGTCHSAQTNFAMSGPRCAAYKQFGPMSGRLDIARFVYQ